jgi:hypothetical protein
MTAWIIVVTVVVTIAAALRSTWSPCGLSMLASITPLAEVGRGHRFRATAAWYVVGGSLGGASLGLCMAALTVAVDTLAPTSRETLLVALGASAVAVVSDLRLGGFQLPVHHRQVNERWLDRFRPWVYGAGFGWQIGTGLATYIMTAAVYLMIVLGALSGLPWLSFAFGVLFGLVRGLSVYLGRHITSAEALRAFHRRFYEYGPKVGRLAVGVQVGAMGLFVVLLSPWTALALGAATTLCFVWWSARRRSRTKVASRGATRRAHDHHGPPGGVGEDASWLRESVRSRQSTTPR